MIWDKSTFFPFAQVFSQGNGKEMTNVLEHNYLEEKSHGVIPIKLGDLINNHLIFSILNYLGFWGYTWFVWTCTSISQKNVVFFHEIFLRRNCIIFVIFPIQAINYAKISRKFTIF